MLMMQAVCFQPATDAPDARPRTGIQAERGPQLLPMMRASCSVHASQPATDAHDAGPLVEMQ